MTNTDPLKNRLIGMYIVEAAKILQAHKQNYRTIRTQGMLTADFVTDRWDIHVDDNGFITEINGHNHD